MAGDEDKKKKKKSKKDKAEKVEEAPPPEPAPAPAPAAPAAPAPAEGEAPPAEGEAPPAEAPAADAPVEGVEGEAEPPPAPKKKPKFFVHWNRRKARFYDYNFDYGGNYYSSMVAYLDNKAATDVPRRMAFAERGMVSSLARKSTPDMRTANLLNDVRTSIKNLESSQRTYMWEHKKVV